MALNLYRRHPEGLRGRSPGGFNGGRIHRAGARVEAVRVRHLLFGNACGRFERKRTGATTWDEARRYSAGLETAGSWNSQSVPLFQGSDAVASPHRTTIADAIRVYLAHRQAANLAPATLRKYGVFMRKLAAFPKSARAIHEVHDTDTGEDLLAFSFDPVDSPNLIRACTQIQQKALGPVPFTRPWWPNDVPPSPLVTHRHVYYRCQTGGYVVVSPKDGELFYWHQ